MDAKPVEAAEADAMGGDLLAQGKRLLDAAAREPELLADAVRVLRVLVVNLGGARADVQ